MAGNQARHLRDDSDNYTDELTKLEAEWLLQKERETSAQEARRKIEAQIEELVGGFHAGTNNLLHLQAKVVVELKGDQNKIKELIRKEPVLNGTVFVPKYDVRKKAMTDLLEQGGALAKKLKACFTEQRKKPSFSVK